MYVCVCVLVTLLTNHRLKGGKGGRQTLSETQKGADVALLLSGGFVLALVILAYCFCNSARSYSALQRCNWCGLFKMTSFFLSLLILCRSSSVSLQWGVSYNKLTR